METKVLVSSEPDQFGNVHEGYISCDIKPDEVIFECDLNEFELSTLMSEILKHCRSELIGWLRQKFGETVDQDEDGIDNWWGFGSYTMYELCLKIDVKYSDGPTVLVIKY